MRFWHLFNGLNMSDLLSPLEKGVRRSILVAEVRSWAKRIGVEERLCEVHVRPMRRKWASVSSRGRLTLSEALLVQSASFRHAVIVHELVHLKLGSGSHGRLFRCLVRAYLAMVGEPHATQGSS